MAQRIDFSWEEETTYKTRPTNIDRYLRIEHGSLEPPFPKREVADVHAHGGGWAPQYVDDYRKVEYPGRFSFEVITGEFLGCILGKVVTTGSDPYEHTMTVSDGIPGSFALQTPILAAGGNVIPEFLGCRIITATFNVGEDSEKLMCDIDMLACKAQDGGATPETVTTSTAEPFLFKGGVFSSTQLYAGAKARIHDVEMKVNRNAKSNYAGGNGYEPYDILPGKCSFGEMKVTIGLEDDTEWDELLSLVTTPGQEYDYSYVVTRGTNDDITFSGNAKIKPNTIKADEHDLRMDLILIPRTFQILVEDSIATYPWE
jgi:hypothetical protein